MTDLYNSFHSIEDDALYFKMYQIGVNREISEELSLSKVLVELTSPGKN